MLPYDLVPEDQVPFVAAAPPPAGVCAPLTPALAAAAAAAATGSSAPGGALPTLSQESAASGGWGGAGGGGSGNAVLVMTKKECGDADSHPYMLIRNIDALFKHPTLGPVLSKLLVAPAASSAAATAGSSSSSSAKPAKGGGLNEPGYGRHFQVLRLLSNQHLAARFELRLGCLLIRLVLSVLRGPGGQRQQGQQGQEAPSLLHLAELLLDHDRPQRWRARERECLERLAQASLQDLEDLVFAWWVWRACPHSGVVCLA